MGLRWTLVGLVLAIQAVKATTDTPTTSYAALGDSYAAGDGAGCSKLLPHFDITCGRFSDAYPVQVANSSELAIPHSSFKNLACGGTTSVSVLHSQVPKIGDSEIVTITVGGNEVDFFLVLNACVHQWLPSEPCEKEMTRARGLVQSSFFLSNFDRMVIQTKRRMKPDAHLLVTGYAAFFNDQSQQCNSVSFSKRDSTNLLTNELRRSFNQMVRMINDVIRAATEAHGATYVDVDNLYDGHRFCEEGVTEPSHRNETWFFNIDFSKKAVPPTEDAQGVLHGPIKDFFDLTRTFHPTSLGHKAIAEEIVRLVKR